MRAVAARQFRRRGDSTALLTPLSVLTGAALWLALLESGIDPVVSGLLIAWRAFDGALLHQANAGILATALPAAALAAPVLAPPARPKPRVPVVSTGAAP